MFYRRILLLGVLESYGGSILHNKLQKVLFLVTRKQGVPSFDFVPLEDGYFSFQANHDLAALSKQGLVIDDSGAKWTLAKDQSFLDDLKEEDQLAIEQIQCEMAEFSETELNRYISERYPDLTKDSQRQKQPSEERAFFTIGYEGISLETYLNKLISSEVRLLCDVRSNPFSRKYGFSKGQLQKACKSVGIKYHHMPELGIDAAQRSDVKTKDDYNRLFDEFEKVTLPKRNRYLIELCKLVEEYGRVAITCFEKEPNECHRSRVAIALRKLPGWDVQQQDL